MGSSAGMPSLAGACVLAAVLRPGSALQRLCTSAHRCRRWVRLSWPARLLGLLPGEERAGTDAQLQPSPSSCLTRLTNTPGKEETRESETQ
jgi:hypothetical protein